MRPLTKENILQRFKKRWQHRFDYSKVVWPIKNVWKSVQVRCKEHNHNFFINPGRHWKGAIGCKLCQYDSYKLDKKKVLDRFKKTWKDRYDYSKFEYENQASKSIIICKDHGEFLQEPVNHWNGHGCPRCALKSKHGLGTYTQNNKKMLKLTGMVYVLEINTEKENFFKVGITKHNARKRILDSGKKLSGKAKVLFESPVIKLEKAHEIEQTVLKQVERHIPIFKYNGWKESIKQNPTAIIKELLYVK